jgi:hypothetical protein
MSGTEVDLGEAPCAKANLPSLLCDRARLGSSANWRARRPAKSTVGGLLERIRRLKQRDTPVSLAAITGLACFV